MVDFDDAPLSIGRVLRASTTSFDCGARSSGLNGGHSFGAFVKAPLSEDGRLQVVGVIYAIRVDDDPLARELVMASALNDYTLYDQRENRMAPVEVCVLAVGYMADDRCIHALPPRPPMSMVEVLSCSAREVEAFTARSEFYRLVLNAREAPSDSLLAASIRAGSAARAAHLQYDYLVACGRACAALLSSDLQRLSGVLAELDPGWN